METKSRPARVIFYYLGHFLIYLGLLIIALVSVWLASKANRMHTAYRTATQHLAALEAAALTGPAQSNLAQAEAACAAWLSVWTCSPKS
jgi:hypothetical protein